MAASVVPLLLAAYTHQKLHRMRMVRGIEPGAVYTTGTVDRKDGYRVTVSYERNGDRTSGQTGIGEALRATLYEGQVVRVALLPGDSSIYVPDDVWANDGNLAFDQRLLAIELAAPVALLLAGVVISSWRSSWPPSAPGGAQPPRVVTDAQVRKRGELRAVV